MSEWHYQKGGNPSEPVSELQLKALADAGVIHSGSLVWQAGFEDWKPISQTDYQYKSTLGPPPVNNPIPNPAAQFSQGSSPGGYGGQYQQTAFGAGRPMGPAIEGLSLFDYFKRAFTKKYVDFQGRARRKEYWGFVLFYTIALMALLIVGLLLDFTIGGVTMTPADEKLPMITLTFAVCGWLATFLPTLAVTIRRMHDVGISGWVYLVSFVPYIGGLVIFVITLINSQAGTNSYGPSPKENADLDVAEVFN